MGPVYKMFVHLDELLHKGNSSYLYYFFVIMKYFYLVILGMKFTGYEVYYKRYEEMCSIPSLDCDGHLGVRGGCDISVIYEVGGGNLPHPQASTKYFLSASANFWRENCSQQNTVS